MSRRPIVITQFDPRSQRFEPLPPVRPDGGMVLAAMMVATLFGLVAGIAVAAWWLA